MPSGLYLSKALRRLLLVCYLAFCCALLRILFRITTPFSHYFAFCFALPCLLFHVITHFFFFFFFFFFALFHFLFRVTTPFVSRYYAFLSCYFALGFALLCLALRYYAFVALLCLLFRVTTPFSRNIAFCFAFLYLLSRYFAFYFALLSLLFCIIFAFFRISTTFLTLLRL